MLADRHLAATGTYWEQQQYMGAETGRETGVVTGISIVAGAVTGISTVAGGVTGISIVAGVVTGTVTATRAATAAVELCTKPRSDRSVLAPHRSLLIAT